ncbi:Uncharacterized protein SCF082_LOCUS2822, partial [Durusdinium trenchii]
EASQQEIVYGWNYCPAGLLMDPSTRHLLPPSRCYYDFLHILFSNGIVCLEITLFWTAVQKHTPLKLADLEAFVQSGFEFKKALNMGPAKVRKLFDPKLMDKHTYGGDAGQTVLALFILEIFAETVLFAVERLEPFLESFRCLAATCRWYFRFKAKRFNHIAHKSSFLIEKISQHLSAFVKCYSSQLVRPKHHFQFHAAEGMDMQEQVLDCWTLERKHRAYKDACRICGCLLVEWPQSLQRLDAVLVVQCMVPSDRKLFLEAEQLEYKHLRANLTMVLCEKEIEETTMRFTSEILPLDVWKQRGFDTEAVKRGKKDVHPLLGEVYAVPLKTVSKGYIKQRVEEMLCKFEADARKKAGCSKGQKALKDGEVSADSTNGAEAVEDDSMKALEWMSGSPQKRAASEMEPEQSEVPAPEEESNEDAKRRKKNNQQIQKLAKKALAKENLPPKSVEELQDALGEVEKMEDECQVGSKVLGPTKALSSLSFGDKELSMYVKDWKNVASRAQRMVKLISKAK